MNDLMKGMILMAVLLYSVSPKKEEPEPVDNIMSVLFGLAAQKQLTERN